MSEMVKRGAKAILAKVPQGYGMTVAEAEDYARAVIEAMREPTEDKIKGLEADLHAAVSVAYRRGAMEWVRLNYPAWAKRLDAEMKALLSDEGTREVWEGEGQP